MNNEKLFFFFASHPYLEFFFLHSFFLQGKDWKRPPYGAFIQPQTGMYLLIHLFWGIEWKILFMC